MQPDAHKNFAFSLVATAPSPATSGTSLTLSLGGGALMPAVPFNATVWPTNSQPTAANAEIVRVTAISTDTLTIVRTQESTNARTIVVGDQFSANITAKIMTDVETYLTPTGAVIPYAGKNAPTNWLLCGGALVSRTTYANLFSIVAPTLGAATITIATPGVITTAAHGLQTGDQVYLTTTGALPTGLTANTLYYVIFQSTTTFNLATSRANALASTAIATSGTQSGVHTVFDCPYGLGDGSTTFNLPDLRGRVVAANDSLGGTGASRLTLAQSQGTYGNRGANGGEQGHVQALGELASHNHGLPNGGTGNTANNPGSFLNAQWTNGTAGATGSSTGTGSQGSSTAMNVIQPTIVMNYIIHI